MLYGSNLDGEGKCKELAILTERMMVDLIPFLRGKYNIRIRRKIRFNHRVFTTSSFFYVRLKS